MTVGKRIKAARKKAGLTQKELGNMLGVTGSMIGQYENDLRKPKFDTLVRISTALRVPYIELETGIDRQEWQEKVSDATDILLKALERKDNERRLAIFAMEHPLFIKALNSVGVTIRLQDKTIFADWIDTSIEITMDDLEFAFEMSLCDFIENIQKHLSFPDDEEFTDAIYKEKY